MSKPDRDHSVEGEPQFNQSPFVPDQSEAKSQKYLDRQRAKTDPAEERATHSVFDEPAILPDRQDRLIDQDWSCRNCGYNLRGLQTGHPCPECGQVERYEPPGAGEESYSRWLREHRAATSPQRSWLVVGIVSVAAVVPAFVYAWLAHEGLGLVIFVVLVPALGESLKTAIAWIVLEWRSYLIQHSDQIYVMALGGAIIFAVVQNIVQKYLFSRALPDQLVVYRWTIGVLAHMACTSVAARGMVAAWRRGWREQRKPDPAAGLSHIVVAIGLHAAVNAYVYVAGHRGYGF